MQIQLGDFIQLPARQLSGEQGAPQVVFQQVFPVRPVPRKTPDTTLIANWPTFIRLHSQKFFEGLKSGVQLVKLRWFFRRREEYCLISEELSQLPTLGRILTQYWKNSPDLGRKTIPHPIG
jgi:hypothetical protein